MLQVLLKIPLILEVLLAFNLMIVVHELGHFLAARWRGMVVEKFGIWFGKPLWKKTIGSVEYSLGTIPFGGFVSLPQMTDMSALEGKSDLDKSALPKVSPLDRIIVAFAGPLFSFGLAVLFAVLVWKVGRPVSEGESTTTIGYVVPDSPAEEAGLKTGDKILSVDGYDVTRFGGMGRDSISWDIVRSEGDTIPIVYQRIVNGVVTTGTVNPSPHAEDQKSVWWRRRPLREIKIEPMQNPMVGSLEKGSVAEKAGLKENDVITRIDGTPAYSLAAVADYMYVHPKPSYILTVERDGKSIPVPFTPAGAKIDAVVDGSPAAKQGLKSGEIVTAVDGTPVSSGIGATKYIRSHGKQPIEFTLLQQDGTTSKVTVTPEVPIEDKVPRVGIGWDNAEFGIGEDMYGKMHATYPTPFEQIRTGMNSIFETIGAMLSSKSDVKLQHMGGPLMMFRVYYMFFQSHEGWRLALWFSVVLNVNLAIINLLPIPVLDGGHITLAIIEAIRRRPVNIKLIETVYTTCAVALFGFMLYILYFDLQDWVGPRQDQFHFAPSSSTQSQK